MKWSFLVLNLFATSTATCADAVWRFGLQVLKNRRLFLLPRPLQLRLQTLEACRLPLFDHPLLVDGPEFLHKI